MQPKLFMIPWFCLIELVIGQQRPTANMPPTQMLTNDLIVDAHQRHFYEMLRRQQQINDALLLNNALLHPHIPTIGIPTNADPLLSRQSLTPPSPTLNPFIQFGQTAQVPTPPDLESTSKLGTYGKAEEVEEKTTKAETETVEKEGEVEAPTRDEQLSRTTKKSLAGVKTVSIQRKGEVIRDEDKKEQEEGEEGTTTMVTSTTTTLSEEDFEVVQLFKKLNLSKAETKSIVQHVEQVVREELTRKLKEAEQTHQPSTVLTTTGNVETTKWTAPSTAPTTTVSTTTPTTTTPTTTTTITTTTQTPTTTMYIPPPVMRVRQEEHEEAKEDLIIHRNNVKHHPITQKLQELPSDFGFENQDEDEETQGSIKTSLTHLPIIVANEEEDRDGVLQQQQQQTHKQPHKATLHKRVLIASHDHDRDSDRDLLVDFATGAPLDLNDNVGNDEYKKELSTIPTIKPRNIPSNHLQQATTLSTILPPRHSHHVPTNFERLATDYRQRLENTGDINKILQKISENAYISLVERGGRRKLFRP